MNAGRAMLSRLAEVGILDEQYTAFLRRHDEVTPFHLPSWSEVIAASYGFAPSVFCIRDDGGEICAASPECTSVDLSGVAAGYRFRSLDACAPLADDPAAAEAFAAALDRHRHESGLKGIEVRGDVARRCRQQP